MPYSRLLLLLFVSAGNYLPVLGQDIHIPEDKIVFLVSKMDSLPYLVSAHTTRTNGKECLLPDHVNYALPGSNLLFPEQVLHFSDKQKVYYAQMYWLTNEANSFYEQKNYADASRYWQKALDIAVVHDFHYDELHRLRVAMNNNYFLAGDYAGAMRISSEGLAKAEKINDKNRAAHFNNVIGYIHLKQKNFDESDRYFSLYLQQAREMKNRMYEAHALFNLGDLALARNQYDSAIGFLQQSIAVYRFEHDSTNSGGFSLEEREAYIFNKMAEAYKMKGDFQKAMELEAVSILIIQKAGPLINDYDKASYYINAGDIYNRSAEPDSAIFFLRRGLAIARRIIHREYMRDACEQLSIAFAQEKIFDSAYYYHRLFFNLWDTIANEENDREILQSEANLKIEKQQQAQQVVLEKQRMWRNVIIAVAIFFIIILYLLYIRYRLRQKNKYQAGLNRQQQEILHTTITVQDKERKRIAEDLHDSLGSILSAAKLKLSAIEENKQSFMADDIEKLETTLSLLDEAVAEIRNISYNIMPATLSKLGLTAALQNLFNRITSKSGLKISFNTHGFTERFDGATEVSIYRIILESVNNVVKHAKAKQVTIQLIRYPDHINITVEDNGQGFIREEIYSHSATGTGLRNILSRVEYMKGSIDMDTKEGSGTTIFIDIPYSN
jgi:two-component system NarL family sensor kinase